MIPSKYLLHFKYDRKLGLLKEFIFNPLFEACDYLKTLSGIDNIEETEINRKVYVHIKYNSSISKAIQKHTVVVEYKPTEVIGDKEPEPDFKFTLAGEFGIFFEAKRIYKNGSYSIYCGKNGLDRFLREYYYSGEHEDGGMIAYVQMSDLTNVKEEIINRVKGISCIKLDDDFIDDFTFYSVHKRKTEEDIKIYHVLFDLTCTTGQAGEEVERKNRIFGYLSDVLKRILKTSRRN